MTDGKRISVTELGGQPSHGVADRSRTSTTTYPDMLRLAAIATALDLSPSVALGAFEAPASTCSGLAALAEASELIAFFLRLDPGERSKVLAEVKARVRPRGSDE